MKALMIGDVFGKAGRRAVEYLLPEIIDHESIDLVIANVENVSGGTGVTEESIRELRNAGVQVMTSGNHIWRKPGVEELLRKEPFLIRPANYPIGIPGLGSVIFQTSTGAKVGVINLLGRVFMEALDCPFRTGEQEILRLSREGVKLILVDFHAEATSEKVAFSWFVEGRVSAVLGTHTHVQTADERILPKGTGYITDVGMTGPHDSVIGVKILPSIQRFLTGVHQRLEPARRNLILHGVLLEICEITGRCKKIARIARHFSGENKTT
jgi:2',3'-cyclic-nucleotide 2'-phosphodiesterase